MSPRFAVLDPCWGRPSSERAFVSRAVAGALACHGTVDIVTSDPVPDPSDGAFDLVHVPPGAGRRARRPPENPEGVRSYDRILLVAPAPPATFELASRLGTVQVLELGGSARSDPRPEPHQTLRPLPILAVTPARVTVPAASNVIEIDVPLSVDVSALDEPLHGIGCDDYLLVLGSGSPPSGDQSSTASAAPPLPAGARWLIARFARSFVLTLERGVVTVWRWRSPLGSVPVATRMDLWRLIGNARTIVDLRPGPLLARESVESMLLGVPVVVPDEGVAGYHAAQGAACAYRDVAELFDAVDGARHTAGPTVDAGRTYAARRYGSPRRLVEQMGAAFDAHGSGLHEDG